MDEPKTQKQTSQSSSAPLYPEPKYGPLGNQTAQYAQPKKYGSKPDKDIQNLIIIIGAVAAIFICAVLIYMISAKGKSTMSSALNHSNIFTV